MRSKGQVFNITVYGYIREISEYLNIINCNIACSELVVWSTINGYNMINMIPEIPFGGFLTFDHVH